jgi:hypothetical protein
MCYFTQTNTDDADHQREGRKTASDRRAQLKAISQSARQTISQGEQERNRKEDEEMARLLQGLVVQQEKKEKELAEKFLEREKKLWAVSSFPLSAQTMELTRRTSMLRFEASNSERRML